MSSGSIITITMNPAIDKSAMVDKIIPEAKLRCSSVKNEPGGGGINVSKALGRLGMDSLAVFTAGGHNGNMLQDLLSQQKMAFRAIPVDAETRENFIVLESSTNNQYRFNISASSVNSSAVQDCLAVLRNLKTKPSFVIASGSLPNGIRENFYVDVAKWATSINAKFILDTSGEPLQLAANEKVFLLKPNLSELRQLAGRAELSKEDAVAAAQQLICTRDCEVIVVSLGAEGALLVTKDLHQFIAAPNVKKQSTVGAGDSMVAGMVYMLSQHKTLQEMIRFGVACGTAATMNPGTELFHIADANKLYEQINSIL